MIAEQLGAGIDAAIAVEIAHQQRVVRRDPAAELGEAIAVVVEADTGCVARERGDATAIEVQGQGRTRLLGGCEQAVQFTTID